MSDPSPPSYSRIAWRLVRAGVYLLLGGTVLFFALTRTEVGRDALRQQVQSSFNDRFAGQLRIGSLQGTLLNEIIATDVALRDEDGTLVATVDSVYARPQWYGLVTNDFSVQSLTIVKPHLRLHRAADSTWNVERVLARRSTSTGELALNLPHVAVRDGRITTTRSGAPPASVQDRWLFDYTRSEVTDLSVDAAVEWGGPDRRVELSSLTGHLPEPDLTLQSGQGRLSKTDSRWSLQDVAVHLGDTRIETRGTVQPAPSDSTRAVADLQLTDTRLDHDELRRLVPRLPVRDAMQIEGRVGGSLDRVVVNQLTVSRGRSTVRIEGTAFGLPDSLNVEAQLLESQVTPSDLRAVWPDAPITERTATGPVQLRATMDGLIQWTGRQQPTFDLDGTVTARGRPGAVRGSLSVRRSPAQSLQYSANVRTDSLNLAPVTGRSGLASRLTGRATIEGRGVTLSSLQGTINATVGPSRIAARSLSAADLQATVSGRSVQGRLSLRQPTGGVLTLQGEADATGPTLVFDATTSTQEFDLAAAHPPLPSTRLNATLRTRGQGDAWRTLTGTAQLDVDSSTVSRADSTTILPPHEVSLDVQAPESDSSRIHLGGTIASATVEGARIGPALWSSGRLWIQALRQAVDRQFASHSSPAAPSAQPTIPAPLRAQAESTHTTHPSEGPIHLRAEGAVHRMDLLRKWWPSAPASAENLQARANLTVSPDSLQTTGRLTASRLHLRGRRINGLDTEIQLAGPLRPDLLDRLTASFSVQADTVRLGERDLTAPSARLSLTRGTGTLRAEAIGLGQTGPFTLNSEVALRPGHTDVTLQDVYVGAGAHAWTATTASTVSVFSDAVVFDSLNVASERPHREGTQQLQIHGTLSSAASDTLYAEMSDVLLYPIAQLTPMSRPLGGRLNGQIALAGGLSQPQLRGAFQVQRLSFDRRVLGTLQVQSRLTPDSPDLLVDASLTPEASALDSLSGPALIPGGSRTLEENRLRLRGRVRLPGWSEPNASMASSDDQLDLSATVDRADLFFFKYIFDENLAKVRGYTAGTIHVGGHFRNPIFDADLAIRDGRFTLPQFGLTYSASGPVDVDREGIHLRGLQVTDESGAATVEGSVLFNDYDYFSFDLAAELDELTIIDVADGEDLPFYGTIRASGPASLTGPLSDATLRSDRARTTPDSELFIPVSESGVDQGTGYIVFADSTGQVPDLRDLTRRDNILSDRPAGEPSFVEGLNIDINVVAPEESTVHLVFDPVVGDVVTAVGAGRVQLQRQRGDFFVYGNFNVSDGTYLFTAGEVFVRRFDISGGTLTWDGPPTNAQLDIEAEYRTRASTAGLPGYDDGRRIPVRVLLDIGGRVETPAVELSLARVRDERSNLVGAEALDAVLNRPDRTTEYATSVLLTNTFLLTTESFTQGRSTEPSGTSSGSLTTAGNQLAFNSVSQLVASQLNRYLGAALPNVDLNFGLQGEDPNDLDVIYGVALRLLNERLVIRGEGVYTGDDPDQAEAQGPQGEFVVELRLSNRVSVEAFYRRTGDELTRSQTLTSSTGAGLSYQTEFSTWRELLARLFGWLLPGTDEPKEESKEAPDPVARTPEESSTAPTTAPEDENPNN